MTEPDETDPAALRPEQQELGLRLAEGRPTPRAGFRGELGRRLQAADRGYGPRPRGLRVAVAAYTLSGTSLLALGTLVAVGIL